jgi:hypothetical protein
MKIKLIAPKMSLRPMDSEFKRLMTPSISPLVIAEQFADSIVLHDYTP